MNKDFKIGLIIGLAVLIAGIAYFIIFDSSDTQPKPETAPETNTLELVETPSQPEFSDSDFPAPTTPVQPETTEVPTVGSTPPTVEVAVSDYVESRNTTPAAETEIPQPEPAAPAATGTETVAPRFSLPVPTVETPPTPAPATVQPGFTSRTPEPTRPATGISASDWAMPGETPAATESVSPVSPVGPVTSTPSTYIVKAGDVGWFIAEKVYGKGMGRYWKKIADANPTVKNFNNLRAGLVLNIPPLPADVTQRIRDRKRAGETITNAAGQKVYIVSKSDTKGLWGISVKFYGKGQYWTKIKKANPGVNPDQLRPGMKLIIPKISTASSTRAYDTLSERTYGSDTVTAVTIRHNYYTVKKGDSFWTIAQKEYGNGKYAYLIKNANQGVDSSTLRPGQKLVIPPKPKSAGTRTRTTSPTPSRRRTAPAAPVPSDEPDFGL